VRPAEVAQASRLGLTAVSPPVTLLLILFAPSETLTFPKVRCRENGA
jgi:hypothetical protein